MQELANEYMTLTHQYEKMCQEDEDEDRLEDVVSEAKEILAKSPKSAAGGAVAGLGGIACEQPAPAPADPPVLEKPPASLPPL